MVEYIVTDIKELTSRRRLVCVNYESAFALYPGEIRRFNIKKDSAISEEDYIEITEGLLVKRSRIRAMNLLKSKDYTVFELSKKLKESYYPDTAIKAAIDYVSAYGYLDDCRYVQNYISFKSGSKSRRQIEMFLHNKGIDTDLIKTECDLFYLEHSDTEIKQAVRYLEKKCGTKDVEHMDYSDKRKLCAYLYRHGFSMDIVRKALDIVVNQ